MHETAARPCQASIRRHRALRSLWLTLCLLIAPLLGATDAQDESKQERAPYQLAVDDTITVTVFQHPEFNTTQPIDRHGQISMPLLEEVQIAGMTLREAEAHINQSLIEARYLAKPKTKVTISAYAVKEAIVLGQVKQTGRIPFPPGKSKMRLIDLISRAGGLTRIAKETEIRITHTNEAGQEERREVDISAMLDGSGDLSEQSGPIIYVYPGDVIFVPERFF